MEFPCGLKLAHAAATLDDAALELALLLTGREAVGVPRLDAAVLRITPELRLDIDAFELSFSGGALDFVGVLIFEKNSVRESPMPLTLSDIPFEPNFCITAPNRDGFEDVDDGGEKGGKFLEDQSRLALFSTGRRDGDDRSSIFLPPNVESDGIPIDAAVSLAEAAVSATEPVALGFPNVNNDFIEFFLLPKSIALLRLLLRSPNRDDRRRVGRWLPLLNNNRLAEEDSSVVAVDKKLLVAAAARLELSP